MLSNNKKKTRESCFEKETITLKIKELELILSQYDRYFKRKLLDISNISGGVSLLITGLTTEVPRLLLFIGLLPLSVFLIIYGGINLVKDFKDKFSIKSLFQEIVASNIPEVRYDSIFVIKDTFNIHSNRYLLYYDSTWRVWFFLWLRSLDYNEIRKHISSVLQIPEKSVKVKLLRTQESTKTSIPSGVKKTYNFTIFEVDINKKGFEQNIILSSDSFNISNRDFRWMTMTEIENNQDILDKNRDVLSIIKSCGYN
ncbi:hypothetical protein [Porphyromonas gingivalis]|uniref:hypothetical protein n=1 Tax=Porphyromonas gingivalis TaxID=837 RepID=UPI0003AD62FD|nr:hypothetical protein [Porphyromonas gingivalis]ERJ89114.1 hypothetical protein HMPREF1989_00034 [Porphyromonas gingivalis F0566]MCE8165999.1 hypothetical protein [Porphyromonas gingivalis]MCE8181113.1 hypothetical protein [Porphyromonas gingivalis]